MLFFFLVINSNLTRDAIIICDLESNFDRLRAIKRREVIDKSDGKFFRSLNREDFKFTVMVLIKCRFMGMLRREFKVLNNIR